MRVKEETPLGGIREFSVFYDHPPTAFESVFMFQAHSARPACTCKKEDCHHIEAVRDYLSTHVETPK